MIDTGSSNLAVAGTGMTGTMASPQYNPALSSTAVASSQAIGVQYVKGSWTGLVYQDIVGITSVSLPNTTAQFAMITNDIGFFVSGDLFQAIVGMAFPSLAVGGLLPYFDQLVRTRGISNIFAMQFCSTDGQLWLGGYDSQYYTGNISWAPIVTPLYYSVTVTDIQFGTTSIGIPQNILNPTGYPPTVDSGTTQLVLNANTLSGLMAVMKVKYPYLSDQWLNGTVCESSASYSPSSITLPINILVSTPGASGGDTYELSVPSSVYIYTQSSFGGACYTFYVGTAGNTILGQAALLVCSCARCIVPAGSATIDGALRGRTTMLSSIAFSIALALPRPRRPCVVLRLRPRRRRCTVCAWAVAATGSLAALTAAGSAAFGPLSVPGNAELVVLPVL